MQDFYRSRDRLVGGSDSPYTAAADFEPAGSTDAAEDQNAPLDMRADDNLRFSGVLSQSELAG